VRAVLSSVRRVLDGPSARQGRAQERLAGARVPAVIQVHDVTKTYALGEVAVHALRGMSVTVGRGEYVAVIGASGSGKSTLMHIIGCLDLPTSGRYLLDGIDVLDMSEDELSDVRNRKIGFVFQSFNLIPRTSALQNVELPLVYGGIRSSAERQRRARRALSMVGLGDRTDHLPNELSGGEQQRVAIARALVTNPSIVLADEPTGALDSAATEELLDIFDRLHTSGKTVVLITHEAEVAARARRVIRLMDGRIVSDERREERRAPGGDRLVTVAEGSRQ
jgi:putative ABC transport system ATP-binding protein